MTTPITLVFTVAGYVHDGELIIDPKGEIGVMLSDDTEWIADHREEFAKWCEPDAEVPDVHERLSAAITGHYSTTI